jgi:hypothetical protein
MMMSLRAAIGVGFLVISVLVLEGCSDKGCEPGGADAGRAGPEELAGYFFSAWGERDIDTYSECLAPNHQFWLEVAIAEGLGMDLECAWWGRAQDVHMMGNMFDSPLVEEVRAEIAVVSGPDTTEGPSGPVLTMRLEPTIDVAIDIGEETPTVFQVHESYLDLEIVPDPSQSGLWVIASIAETAKRSGSGATEPTRLTQIKGMFMTCLGMCTADDLLKSFAASHEAEHIEWYSECLSDAYRFIFTDEDADSLDAPYWTRPEDVAAMTNMFEATEIRSIDFELDCISQEIDYAATEASVELRTEPSINVTVEYGAEPPMVFLVRYVYLDFTLVPDPVQPELWIIDSIEEVKQPLSVLAPGPSPSLVEYPTWGSIRLLFR